MKKSKSYIILTAIFKREEEVWTAECKEPGTATFGDTLEEAKENLQEAIELHLNTLKDVGEYKRFLDERGIEIHYRNINGHLKTNTTWKRRPAQTATKKALSKIQFSFSANHQ